MKRLLVLFAFVLPLAAACGRGPQVFVDTSLTLPAAEEPLAVGDLPIRLLPYDRDAIFDSLEAAHAEPEPPIPQELLAQQQEIQTAESEWRIAEERWSTVRDSLRMLSQELGRMGQAGQRATPQYQQRFREFERLEAEVRQVQQRSQSAFARYDQLQRTFLQRADSVRVIREQWADRAFADFDRVVNERLRRIGREEYADTTNDAGLVRFRGVPRGRWWVYARYTLPFEELYWNIPLEVTGDSVGVTLSRENAEVRPVM